MNNKTITAIILTRNEEEDIEACINSLLWCDEIIIVDDYSEDRTLKIIQNYNSKFKIIKNHLNDNYSEQRNFGLKKATGDWILFIDSDEIVSNELQHEIITKTQYYAKAQNGDYDDVKGFYIKRKDYFLGRFLHHGETGNIKLLRLAKKNSGTWSGTVHETWTIKGRTEILQNPILHYPHHSISSFLSRINYYTDILAHAWQREGRKIHFWSIVLYPKGKFIQNYIFRLGFLDGIPGLIMAIMMSFHSFSARSKLWLLQNKKQNG